MPHFVGTNHCRRLGGILHDDGMNTRSSTLLLHAVYRSVSVMERESHGHGLISEQCNRQHGIGWAAVYLGGDPAEVYINLCLL